MSEKIKQEYYSVMRDIEQGAFYAQSSAMAFVDTLRNKAPNSGSLIGYAQNAANNVGRSTDSATMMWRELERPLWRLFNWKDNSKEKQTKKRRKKHAV